MVQTIVQKGVQTRVLRVYQQDVQRDRESGVLISVQISVLSVDWTGDPKWVWITVLTVVQRVGSIRSREGEGKKGVQTRVERVRT